MTSSEQSLLRQFRLMLCEKRKNDNIATDKMLSAIDDMELQATKEQGVPRANGATEESTG